jgi:cytochrome c oxidase assembly protein subunit 15
LLTLARRLADGVAIACIIQLGAGVLNVLLLAPVWMQLVHLAIADLIWIGATWMILEGLATNTEVDVATSSISVESARPAYVAEASRAR